MSTDIVEKIKIICGDMNGAKTRARDFGFGRDLSGRKSVSMRRLASKATAEDFCELFRRNFLQEW